MQTYKRQFRQLSDETKQKISNSSKGKTKSYSHKQHISQSMKDYWSRIPSRHDTYDTTYQGEEKGENNAGNLE